MTGTDRCSHDPVVLHRRLERERARRHSAEQIGERATAELFDLVEQLRQVKDDLLDRSERDRILHALSRRFRPLTDAQVLADVAAAEAGALLGGDRCEVHAGHPDGGAVLGRWGNAPLGGPADGLPPQLQRLFLAAASERPTVVVHDLLDDPRLAGLEAPPPFRSLAGAPIRVASQHLGWLLLAGDRPRRWTDRDLTILERVSLEVGARMFELWSDEQQQALTRLKDLDRTKDLLVTTVSHELRTPLSSIAGYLELLEDGDLGEIPKPALSALAVMGRNVERLTDLVGNLLTLAERDAEESIETSEVDLVDLASECHDAISGTAATRDIDVTLALPRTGAVVRGDRDQLAQVLVNLLSNAVKFTPRGGSVTTHVVQGVGGVEVVVSDTGMGIPQRELEAVFTRFFRSSLAVAHEIQGAGLGLAVTRSIVEAHGGTISLDSVEGDGTTVRVSLPSRLAG